MIPFLPIITSVLPKILTNKWLIAIIVVLCLIIGAGIMYNRAYHKGELNGISITEAKYNIEKLKWIDKVSKMQQEHEDTMNGILTSYNGLVAEYEHQIEALKNQDPIIKTRYIHKYVPVETNCTIPKGFVDLHNTAAKGMPLSEDPKDAAASTNVTLQDVGSTVAINYYQYNKISAQLKALQEVVIQFQTKQKELVQ